MDHNANAADRHVNDQMDEAKESHVRNMHKVFCEVQDIESKITALKKQRTKLMMEVEKALGYAVGDIVQLSHRGGVVGKITRLKPEFHPYPGDDECGESSKWIAAVDIEYSPENKGGGFNARERRQTTIFDEREHGFRWNDFGDVS